MGAVTFTYLHLGRSLDSTAKARTKRNQRSDLHHCPEREREREGGKRNKDHNPVRLRARRSCQPDGE